MTTPNSQPVILRTLGECSLQTPSGEITPRQEMVFAAAILFALSRTKKLSREALESYLWPNVEPVQHAHHRLRQTILILKQAGLPIIRENGFLRSATVITVDYKVLLDSPEGPELSIKNDSLEFLPNYNPRISTNFSHWLDEKRSEVQRAVARLLLTHIRRASKRGDWDRVEQLSSLCQPLDPFSEDAIVAKVEAVAHRGDRRAALLLLDRFEEDAGDLPSSLRIPLSAIRRRISESRDWAAYDLKSLPLLGRADNLACLNSALERTESGSGEICVVEGAIGMGKSRLGTDFSDSAHLRGAAVRLVRCSESDKTRALSIFIDLIPGLLKMRGSIGCSPDSLQVLNNLSCSLPPKASIRDFDPSAIYDTLIAALFDLLDALTEETTLVLVIDDAQWVDKTSASILEALIKWVETHKVMIVFLVRSPAVAWPTFDKMQRVQFTSLRPLSSDEAIELITTTLRKNGKSASAEAVTRFVAIGEGNPFFLGELVRHYIESGVSEETPPSLRAITDKRLYGLSESGKQILQACAVLGRYSSVVRLEQLLQYKSFELFSGLNELGNNSLICTERSPGDSTSELRIVCSHELIGAAALRLISQPALIAIHRRVAQLLEDEAKHNYSSGAVWESAVHWEKAGDPQRAVRLMMTYATHLMSIGLPNDAINVYARAETLCISAVQRLDLLKESISALHMAGAWKDLVQAISEVTALSRSLDGDTPKHSDLELIQFEAMWRSSHEWRDLLHQVSRCVFDNGATADHRVRAAVLGLKLATNVGTGEEVDEIYAAIEPLLENASVDYESRLYVQMVYQIDRGDMELGRNAAKNLVEYERDKGDIASLIWALVNASQAMRRCGHLQESMEYLHEAFRITTEKNLPIRACTVAHHIVRTALALDDVGAARHWLGVAESHPSPREDQHTNHERLFYAARIALADGNVSHCKDLMAQISVREDQSLLRRISLTSLRLRVATMSKAPRTDVEQMVDELTDLYTVQCSRGGQDFEAFSLYLGRDYLGQTNIGLMQLQEYATTLRRERGDLPTEIARCLAHAKIGD